MPSRFQHRTVVITGASAGIGAAAARRFAAEGASLVLAARGKERLEALAEEIRAGGSEVLAVPTDVAEIEQCRALVAAAAKRFGGIDVLVNNAGANVRGPVEEQEPEQLAQVVAVNLTAPVLLTRLAIPQLRRSTAAAVVNVASLAGRVPLPHEATYSATKFGLRAFSMAVADELAEHDVRVSIVSPGPVDTGFLTEDLDSVPDMVLSQPLATPDEIARLIVEAAAAGPNELVPDRLGGYMTTLGYVFPALRRALKPVMEGVGRRRRRRLRRG